MIKLAPRYRVILNLINHLKHDYHIQDLMKSNIMKMKQQLYQPFSHLYISKMEMEKFNEKKVVKLLIEQQKMEPNSQHYKKIFSKIENNISQLNDFKTVSFFMQVGFEINWKNEQFWHKLTKQGFLLLRTRKQEDQEKSYSYSVCKFLIAVNRLSRMDKYSDQQYNAIKVDRFKPLFLTYMLQLFWQNGLENKYTLPKNIVNMLVKHEELIPFADIHHMLMAKKIIRDPLFLQIIDRMQVKLKTQVKTIDGGNNNQTRICPQVTQRMFEEYINDLREKYL